MICPVCGSSHIYEVKKNIITAETRFYCYDCDHFFDREDVKDFNEEVIE